MTSLATSLQAQQYRYLVQVPQGTWRWTTLVDVSAVSPRFEITDIYTPFGLLRDSISIPGEVVTAMADSIQELQQVFAPAIALVPTTLVFTVDEGRGVGDAKTVSVSNVGAYGSLLSLSVSTSSPAVTVAPAQVGGLPSHGSGQFAVSVDSTNLLATSSPYAVTLSLQDASAVNSPQVLPVSIVVRPKAAISTSTGSLVFSASGAGFGSFAPVPNETFQVINAGDSSSLLSYQIQKLIGLSDWLVSFDPAYGSLNGSASQTITVAVQPPPTALAGVYTETLRVSGYSSNHYQDVVISLTVS